MYLSALKHDKMFCEIMFQKTRVINERQAWLLYLVLKHEEYDLFDDCMRLFRRNVNRFRESGSYSLDRLLLSVTDRLRGRIDEAHFTEECYKRIHYFAEMIAFPRKRRRVEEAVKDALRFYLRQQQTEKERSVAVYEHVLRIARQTKDRRIRERDVKYPLWEEGHTVVPYRIAGLRYHLSKQQISDSLVEGTILRLEHEQDNRFDMVAVAVTLTDGTKVGYIEKPYNRAFCEMINQGTSLSAMVTETEEDVLGISTIWITVFKTEPDEIRKQEI